MEFSFRHIRHDPNCSSHVLLDSSSVYADALITNRTRAQLDYFPCRTSCCTERKPEPLQVITPLKLALSLSSNNLFSIHVFLRHRLQYASSYALKKHSCTDTSQQSTCTHLQCGICFNRQESTIDVGFFIDDISIHNDSFQNFVDFRVSESSFFVPKIPNQCISSRQLPEFADKQIHQSNFSTISCEASSLNLWELTPYVGAHSSSHADVIEFDDRKPQIGGLTGMHAWLGLHEIQNIKIVEVVFWSTKEEVVGFRAIYVVDGKRRVGPRHCIPSLGTGLEEQRFSFLSAENIVRLMAYRSSAGNISHIAFSTDFGRSFRAGCKVSLVTGSVEIVKAIPSPRMVSFRGAIGKGLVNFSVIYTRETRESFSAFTSGALRRCMVCGAASPYFLNEVLFDAHVERCFSGHKASNIVDGFHPGANIKNN